jgi:hypothetical protein
MFFCPRINAVADPGFFCREGSNSGTDPQTWLGVGQCAERRWTPKRRCGVWVLEQKMLWDAISGQCWRYNFGAEWYWVVMWGTWKSDSLLNCILRSEIKVNSVHRIFRANFFCKCWWWSAGGGILVSACQWFVCEEFICLVATPLLLYGWFGVTPVQRLALGNLCQVKRGKYTNILTKERVTPARVAGQHHNMRVISSDHNQSVPFIGKVYGLLDCRLECQTILYCVLCLGGVVGVVNPGAWKWLFGIIRNGCVEVFLGEESH